ncbi:SunI/YnzG family protein [Priestia aryabhattai]|uniref:SunI/YnzG family protein n=1 Tax=Priestia aryabhattai TaxID=412384 RepID=UPI00159B9737|nr:hypothetical protein [Priestia aryabhattai]
MFTPTISVRKINDNLIIKWQLAHFTIPLEDILEVTEDDTYGGKEANAPAILNEINS